VAVTAGDLLLVPAMARRWWQADGNGTFTMAWVEFLVSDREPLDLPSVRLHLPKAAFAEMRSAWARIAEAARQGGHAGRLLQEADVRALIARVLLDRRSESFSATDAGNHGDGAVRAALGWLERHYADATPERGLAGRVGLSEAHFRTRFRASVGTNPRAFVLDLRLHAARGLLAAGSMGIKQVAATVGYRDPLLFSRLYRRRWGVAPSRDAG
jgi:AraC-like DNA-binding protein